jgi:hypothetical protein
LWKTKYPLQHTTKYKILNNLIIIPNEYFQLQLVTNVGQFSRLSLAAFKALLDNWPLCPSLYIQQHLGEKRTYLYFDNLYLHFILTLYTTYTYNHHDIFISLTYCRVQWMELMYKTHRKHILCFLTLLLLIKLDSVPKT